MEEILKKLVESELLTEETRKEVLAGIKEAVESMVESRVSAAVKVKKAELEEQFKQDFLSERQKIAEAIDDFLADNLREGITADVREEFKAQFVEERAKIVEAISDFLEMSLSEASEDAVVTESHDDLAARAFFESVKALMLGEQDVPAEAEKVITKLQESLEKKDEKINELYGKLIESNKRIDKVVLESKVAEFLRMIPDDKKSIARRLVEGIELSKFDEEAKGIRNELLESSEGDLTETDGTQAHEEVIVEAQPHIDEKSGEAEKRRLRKLSGIN